MSKERVQIIIRVMPDEKETIQQLAKEEDKSMNQFIVDRVLSEPEEKEEAAEENDSDEKEETGPEALDSMSTSGPVFALLRDQIHAKDRQINKLQVLIDQQQQLSLSDKRENERLRLSIEELEAEETEDVEEENLDEEAEATEEADSPADESAVDETASEEKKANKRWWKLWE